MSIYSVESLLSFIFVSLISCQTDAKKCEDPRYREQSFEMRDSPIMDQSKLPPEYTCPRSHDPKTFTECCWDGGCCRKALPATYEVDDTIMMFTAITVIVCCIVLTIITLICCFSSKCPFYNTCRVNYNSGDVVLYSLTKEDDPMPVEHSGGNRYVPNPVKIKPVEEV